MRIHRQFGIFGAGTVACAASFCLSAAAGWSQTSVEVAVPESVTEQEPWQLPSSALSLQQLHDQQQAVLNSIDRINHQTDAAFARHALAIDSKLDFIQLAFSEQRQQELEVLRHSNRLMLTTSLGLAGVSILGMLFVAWLPLRTMNRLAAGVRASILAHAFNPGPLPSWGESVGRLAGEKESESAGLRLQAALDRLERRLSAMEGAAARLQDEDRAVPEMRGSKAAAPPARARPVVAKAGASPHVALAIGEGESLFFLPSDRGPGRFQPFKKFWPKIQKFFVAPRLGKRD